MLSGAPGDERSWVASLSGRLRDLDHVELLDLLPVLSDGARYGSAYHRTDADWNDRGAFFAARALLKEAHKHVPALHPPALADLHLRQVPAYRGTLAEAPKVQLLAGELVPCQLEVEAEHGVVIDSSELHALRMPVERHLAEAGSTHLRVYAAPEQDDHARLALIGDEAALALVPWLAERASRTTFFWTRGLPLDQLELELPPIVLHLIREADLLGGSLADIAAQATTAPPAGRGASSAAHPIGSNGAGPARDGALATSARETAAKTRAALRTNAWTIALVGLLTALSWPFTNILGGPGLDNSWEVGLDLAVAHGLAFGQQAIFTYGPLGFSFFPVAITPGTFLAAWVLGGLVQVALVAVLLANLRRRLGLLAASLLTLLAASLVGWVEAEPLTAIAFGLVALTLTTPAHRAARAFRVLAIGGGVLAGFALLVKLNDGVAASAIVALGLLGGDTRRRNLAVAGASLLGTLLTLWLLVGEPLGALPDYLRNGYEVIGGYVEAMGHNEIGPSGEWQVWLVLGSALALGVGAWRALSINRLRRRAALASAVVLVHYFLAREIFVRYDGGHIVFLGLLVAVALMIPWTRAQRASGLALACLIAVAVFAVLRHPVSEVVDPLVTPTGSWTRRARF